MTTGFTGFWPSSAASETLTRSFSYFTIGGVTPVEIEEQLSRLGPEVKSTGSRHPGATRLEFTSRITYASTEERCRISGANVAIKAEVILPRWRRTSRADVGSRLFWDALSSDIVRHEESHLVIARNHARELERGLMKLRPAKNCDDLAAEAKIFQNKILAKHDAEQQRFDRIEAINIDKRLLGKLKRRIDQLTNVKQPPPS